MSFIFSEKNQSPGHICIKISFDVIILNVHFIRARFRCLKLIMGVTVQKARDPIASANRIFIRNTPKYSGCEEINGRAGADLSAVQVQISSAVQVQ